MNFLKKSLTLTLMIVGITSCSSDKSSEPDKPAPVEKIQIKIKANASATRVSDNSFDNGDKVGVYVVNYTGETAGTLKNSGNHVDNMKFTYNGTWNSDSPVYWKDNTTHADFYLYYPHSASVSNVNALSFETNADQSSLENYKASEFLAGTATNVTPTSAEVSITARHLMSQINVLLEAGEGFKDSDLTADKVEVRINGIKTKSTINLASGAVTATGDAQNIKPFLSGTTYKALLPPQSVEESNLISVTVDGKEFNLRKAFTFETGKLHKFTVRLSKTSNGINVNISAWEDDGTDNGGTAV